MDKYYETFCPRCGDLSGENLQLVLKEYFPPQRKEGYYIIVRCEACLLNEIVDIDSSDVKAIVVTLKHLEEIIGKKIIEKVDKG